MWLRVLALVGPHRLVLALAVVCSVVAAGAAALWASLVGPLLRSLMIGGAVSWGPFMLEHGALTSVVPLAVVGLALLKAVAGWVMTGLTGTVAQRVLGALRVRLYERLLSLDPEFFERRHSGDLLSRFTADLTQLENVVGQALTNLIKDSLQIIALAVVCWVTDWRLFLVLFVVLPGTIVPVSRFARSAKKAATRTQASLGQLTVMASELLQTLPVVQAYRAERFLLERFDHEQGRYLTAMKRSLFVRGAFSPTTEFLGVIGVALAVVWGARAVAAEPALAGSLVTFLAVALLLYQPLKAIGLTTSQVAAGAGAATRLFEVLDAPVPLEPDARPGPLRESLEIDSLEVTYADGRRGLDGASFRVRAGEQVAVVGASGAGKSTLLSVLLGHRRPSAGTIRWDGRALEALSRSGVRAQLAWVPQEPVLHSGTVRENVTLGAPSASEGEVWRALERAHAATFVRAFSRRLDEPVGERGSALSGGQRQRLAIARAFLMEPSFLLLDEPTSALDGAAEAEVQAGLKELMKGRTTLVIAHRLSTVRAADRIVVLHAGRVVEQGTHDDLLTLGGVYAQLHFASEPTTSYK